MPKRKRHPSRAERQAEDLALRIVGEFKVPEWTAVVYVEGFDPLQELLQQVEQDQIQSTAVKSTLVRQQELLQRSLKAGAHAAKVIDAVCTQSPLLPRLLEQQQWPCLSVVTSIASLTSSLAPWLSIGGSEVDVTLACKDLPVWAVRVIPRQWKPTDVRRALRNLQFGGEGALKRQISQGSEPT